MSSASHQPHPHQREHALPILRSQVGGSKSLYWNHGAVFKPLDQQEYEFYRDLAQDTTPPAFSAYVPKFFGVVALDRLTDEMGLMQPSEGYDVVNEGAEADRGGEEMKMEAETELEIEDDERVSEGEQKQQRQTSVVRSAHSSSTISFSASSSSSVSSSSSLCSSEELSNQSMMTRYAYKLLRKSNAASSRSKPHYLVLEDLSFAFKRPCIIDLKVGTRQHGADEAPDKVAIKVARCLRTTSSVLGLRLCGMQVYSPLTKTFLFRDKYFGRSLTAETFKTSLRDYFYDGERVLTDLLQLFILRLEEFKKAILESARGRLFPAVSLLLIYEGDRKTRQSPLQTIERPPASRQSSDTSFGSSAAPPLVHNSNSTATSRSRSTSPIEDEEENKSSTNNHSSSEVHDPLLPLRRFSSDLTMKAPMRHSASMTLDGVYERTSLPPAYSPRTKISHSQAILRTRARDYVELRLIDFAHTSKCTKSDREGEIDDSFMFGIDSLLRLFNELLN